MISLTGCFCGFLRDLLLGSTHFPRKSSWEGPFQDSLSDPHLVYVIFAYIPALPNCAIIAVPFFFSHHRSLQPTSPLDICWNWIAYWSLSLWLLVRGKCHCPVAQAEGRRNAVALWKSIKTTLMRTEAICSEPFVIRKSSPALAFSRESKAGRGVGKLQSIERGMPSGFLWLEIVGVGKSEEL